MPELTPDQWRDELEAELANRQPRLKLYRDYYAGRHRLSFATSKFKEAFGDLFGAFATNWCGLVVDVAVERLRVQGFRFGGEQADDDAWAIWQANGLDTKSIQGHTEAVKCGMAYLLVGPPKDFDGEPVITVEHPSQFIVATDPADRRNRLAALKHYKDRNGDAVSVLYLPDEIIEYRREGAYGRLIGLGIELPTYAGTAHDRRIVTPNPLGIVPGIPLENCPDLLTGGTSDLDPAIALNDAANKFFTDMIHASEFTSFPQRVLTGVELPRDPVTGDVLSDVEIRAAVGRLWAFEDPAAAVTQLNAGDLSNYVEGIDLAVQHLAAQTRTPPHYLLAKLANISGDALKAAETGLAARCRRMTVDFSDPWEEAMRLAFKWRAINRNNDEDKRRSELTGAETIWADVESRHPSQVSDSLVKKQDVGVPWETLMEEAGYSPQQIARMKEQRDQEQERQFQLDKLKAGLYVNDASNANDQFNLDGSLSQATPPKNPQPRPPRPPRTPGRSISPRPQP